MLIDEYKLRQTFLPKPEQIPNNDFQNITATVDTAHSKSGVINNEIFSVKTGMVGWQPIFAREQLTAGQSC